MLSHIFTTYLLIMAWLMRPYLYLQAPSSTRPWGKGESCKHHTLVRLRPQIAKWQAAPCCYVPGLAFNGALFTHNLCTVQEAYKPSHISRVLVHNSKFSMVNKYSFFRKTLEVIDMSFRSCFCYFRKVSTLIRIDMPSGSYNASAAHKRLLLLCAQP